MKFIIDNIKKNWLLNLIFLIYVVLIFIIVFKHEQWADEAQAWLLARDSSLFGLLFKNLRYEGHPPLWYLILMLPSKFLPYRAISVISVLIAVAGIYIFLHYSSFPKVIKILFPFSYFIFYQYGLVARSYVLLPILFFLIARVYKNKTTKIYQFTALVCLLANVSVYTMMVSLSIMLVHLIDLVKNRSELNKKLIMKQVKAYIAFVIVIGLVVIILWQPQDSSFAKGYNFSVQRFFSLSYGVLDEIMTEVIYISVLVLVISLIWFWQNRLLLLYLLSTLAVLFLFSIKYYNSWHQGIIFLVWAFVIWISFENQGHKRFNKLSGLTRKAVIASFLLVLGFQIYWSASASISDFQGTYSGGEGIAEYIKNNKLEDKKICTTSFWSTTVLPYFDKNIFANHNNGEKPAFWFWKLNNRRTEDIETILKDQPDLIIIGRPGELRELQGYEFVDIFEGNLYWKNRIKENNDFA
ncbi:hypothetical protein H8E77_36745, partial [bacterium]|nr:hypothetical protein [bacterium]